MSATTRPEPPILLDALLELASVRTLEEVTGVVLRAARRATGADGVAFVLRDEGNCHYVAEDAVEPLWQGRRFPMGQCVSGWVMVAGDAVVIPDVFADGRIPHDLYRQTFVRSLAMVPVRRDEPVGAIGAYWAQEHLATAAELAVLHALADAAALALVNVELYERLNRALEREREARRAAEGAASIAAHHRALASAEERLRRIIDSLADAVVVVDGEGVVKFANPAAERLFGRPREEVIGEQFGLPLVAGATTEIDLKDGRVAELRVVEVAWDEAPALLASLRDVTARREAEAAARRLWRERTSREEAEKERGRLEELLARAPAAILTTRGRDHVVASANPEMRRLAGDREPVGRPLAEALPELAGGDFLAAFDATFHEGVGRSHTALPLSLPPVDGAAGREWHLDVTWEPLRRDGGVDGVLCFAYDVSAQVAMRRELEGTMARLREEERAKDQFLAVLGHELRNPLAGIDTALQLLELGAERERAERALGVMRKQVASLTRLLDDLFDVSSIVRGKLEVTRAPVAWNEIVEAAVASLQGRYAERAQRLVVELPPDPLFVEGDPRRLAQVLANLLANASKYSPPATTVELRLRRDGDQAVVEIADRGMGLAPEMTERIFEPFFQVRSGSPLAGGLGIGLTLVRQLVELHGGRVEVASPGIGKGSTFTVRLPLAEPPRPQEVRPAPSEAATAWRVLVVDDNEDAALALAELLALHGCEAAVATSGGEGLAKAASERPEVVLLDLDLPDMSGYEVAERLRAGNGAAAESGEGAAGGGEGDGAGGGGTDRATNGGGAGTLIVAVSGFGHEEARAHSRASGIDHHLVKPVAVDDLLALLAAELPARSRPGPRGG